MLTYVLIVLLWYPTDNYLQEFEVGADLSWQECSIAAARATTQLQSTLSTAELVSVVCEESRRI